MIQDAVKQAVAERLSVLSALAARLEKIVAEGDPPAMLVCRLAVDVDHSAALLSEHCRLLETAHKGAL